MLTFNELKEIINLVDQSCIQHFELNHEATKIVIDKHNLPSNREQKINNQGTTVANLIPTLPSEGTEEQVSGKETLDQGKGDFYKVVSPTVGTFYSAPEPGAEPFVKIGQQVNSSTVLCVLEAMKLFNEVEAGVNGEVIEALVKDGDFIEYGHPLFLIKPE